MLLPHAATAATNADNVAPLRNGNVRNCRAPRRDNADAVGWLIAV
jgi:hypothetical protein